jgi:uncharacterized membrane protein
MRDPDAVMDTLHESGISEELADQVARMVKSAPSARLTVAGKVPPDRAQGLQWFGGTAVESSLSMDAQAELQEALLGAS